jgi:hypothetical protein
MQGGSGKPAEPRKAAVALSAVTGRDLAAQAPRPGGRVEWRARDWEMRAPSGVRRAAVTRSRGSVPLPAYYVSA